MITVLQRQRVSRRPDPPFHLRARTVGVHWRNGEPSAPPPSSSRQSLAPRAPKERRSEPVTRSRRRPTEAHSFLEGQLVRRKRRRELRKIERSIQRIVARQETRRPPAAERREGPRPALPQFLRSPWLLLGLLGAALAVVLVPSIGPTVSLGAQHPALPASEDADPALYALLVPEPTTPQDGGVNPIVLSSLKVGQYRTQAGDSLSKIAARFKLNIDTLVSWNGIRDAHSIAAGTQLAVPNSDGLKYRVRRGDTLQGIANTFGVELNNLLDANLLSSSVISVGQDLFLPGARMSPTELGRILGSLFMYPVMGPISSFFGSRPDPFTGAATYHNGVDIVNRPGTPILAAMAGTVAQVGWNYSYGYYVIMKHSGNYQTLYGHLTRYIVSQNQKIQQGQKIGELGTTGYSTGPHLHFSIFKNGQPVDPLRFLK